MAKEPSNSAGNTTRARAHALLDMLLLIFVIASSLTGFRQQPPPLDSDADRADHSAGVSSTRARYAPARAKDQGDFKLRYEPRADFKGGIAGHRAEINRHGIECVIDLLNERMALPFDIVIEFKECDGPEAFYDDQTHQVTVCYELIDDHYYLFSNKISDEARLDEAVWGAIAFAFLHELAHALIDAWGLPVTGREEDAADQLSNLILVEEIEGGEQMALDGALFFKLYADWARWEEKIYWDEHSLDEQRFYNIICMLYGHDPEKYSYLMKDRSLPPERAELCNKEYAKLKTSWQTLLSPYMNALQNGASKIRLR